MRFRLLVTFDLSQAVQRRALLAMVTWRSENKAQALISPASATWCLEHIVHACAFACQCHVAPRKHFTGLRCRLPVPIGASKTFYRLRFRSCISRTGVGFRLPHVGWPMKRGILVSAGAVPKVDQHNGVLLQ
jgi:hypothetical protein